MGRAVLNNALDVMLILQVEIDTFQQPLNKLASQRDVRIRIRSTCLGILKALTRLIIVQEPDDSPVRAV